jgi:DNA-binding MarR family transcriptional regulator
VSDDPNSALLMFIAHRAAETRVFEALRTAGFDDLTLAQCRIAQRLSPDGIRVTDLAEHARVTKRTAGALVDELEDNGYVARRRSSRRGPAW